MAVQNSIDPPSRSQDFYLNLYQCFKSSPLLWYIKDAEHHFLDASNAFINDFFLAPRTAQFPFRDAKLLNFEQREVLHDAELEVLSSGTEKKFLSTKVFRNKFNMISFFMTISPVVINEKLCTLTILKSLADCYDEVASLNFTLIERDGCDMENMPHQFVIDDFKEINPQELISDKQWEVAWLIIAGLTFKEIAKFLNVSQQAVTERARNMYANLRVFNVEGLKFVARCYSWIDLVPFNSDGFLIEVNEKTINLV